MLPYSPDGAVVDGEEDGDGSAATAGAVAAPITAMAARAAALLRRRTFMIGGCLSCAGSGGTGHPGGSAPYASTVPVPRRVPGT